MTSRAWQYRPCRRWLGALPLLLALAGCGDRVELAPGEERPAHNEAQVTADMIDAIREISLQRDPEGTVRRFNQVKTLGCLRGTLSVLPDIAARHAHGIFAAPRQYPVTLRFARATEWDDRDKDFHGLSIRVHDVPGAVLWGQPGEQDFLLNSHPALFAGTPDDFLDFIQATRDGAVWRYLVNPAHWYSLPVLLRGRQVISNPLGIRYWSTTPSRLGGETTAVKYSVQSCTASPDDSEAGDSADYLAAAMARQLADSPACLAFAVQEQGDPVAMPLENAAVTWDEDASPFRRVATIKIEDQPFRSPERLAACEAMTFNPWQSLAAHRPVGGINRVRKAVYAELGRFRARVNAERAGH